MIDAMFELPSSQRRTFKVDGKYVEEKLRKSHFELNKGIDSRD